MRRPSSIRSTRRGLHKSYGNRTRSCASSRRRSVSSSSRRNRRSKQTTSARVSVLLQAQLLVLWESRVVLRALRRLVMRRERHGNPMGHLVRPCRHLHRFRVLRRIVPGHWHLDRSRLPDPLEHRLPLKRPLSLQSRPRVRLPRVLSVLTVLPSHRALIRQSCNLHRAFLPYRLIPASSCPAHHLHPMFCKDQKVL